MFREDKRFYRELGKKTIQIEKQYKEVLAEHNRRYNAIK